MLHINFLWIVTIGNVRIPWFSLIPGLGSRILNPYFGEHNDNFLAKKSIGSNFFSLPVKKKFYFMKFVATKKVEQQMFSPPLLLLFFACEIRDPGSEIDKNQDPRDKHPGSTTLTLIIGRWWATWGEWWSVGVSRSLPPTWGRRSTGRSTPSQRRSSRKPSCAAFTSRYLH